MWKFLPFVLLVLSSFSVSAQNIGEPPAEPAFNTQDTRAYGRELMEYADSFDSGWVDEVLRGQMELVDAAGRSVSRGFVRMVLERAPEGDKVITRFTSPNDIRGVAALTYENRGTSDDNWLYLPATKRVRRISGANNTSSFQGTEFTYEDLSSLDPSEYTFTYLGEATISVGGTEYTTHRIGAEPTYEDTGYARLVIFLDPNTWTEVQIDYYDLADTLLKTRWASELEQFHGRYWRAQRLNILNHQTGKRTNLTIDRNYLNLSMYPDQRTGEPRKNLDESVFTTRALVK